MHISVIATTIMTINLTRYKMVVVWVVLFYTLGIHKQFFSV